MNDKWDKRFLGLAKEASTWSKDPSTQLGAVIVRPNKSICSVGFNGFPQDMPDDEELYNNREEKYDRIIHAELNALTFSADQSLEGYSLYTYPIMPCHRCFVILVQNGIRHFIAPKASEDALSRWEASFNKVHKYVVELNVERHKKGLPLITLDLVDYE